MLDALHYSFNRQRFSPCTQSMGDQFRVPKYDLSHSLSGTNRTTPLLVERHGVWPGMFLMYVGVDWCMLTVYSMDMEQQRKTS
ncbi:hypothetical protein GBAR_LOCUS15844 [Geodia barretti]|uniref:Uncharacterized protein n=1 Tax=Geodia barretti TaxID=519541 RepID=A0AA35SFC1_GEOBA|nr:hypothetical protein GBAR_LOCUS15844 [Geodia barretti]